MQWREGGDSLNKYRIFETDEYLEKSSKLPPGNAESTQKKLQSYVYPQLRKNPFHGTAKI